MLTLTSDDYPVFRAWDRQVDTNTIYRIGSITKLITNVMLFQLRDQGKLSIDDPVSVR